MRLTFSVGSLTGLAARFRANDAKIGRNARRVVLGTGDRAFSGAYADAPKRTHFMVTHLRLEVTKDGLAFFVGFRAVDFTKAGFAPYFLFVILGTRYQAANDFVTPNVREARRHFRTDMHAALSSGWRGVERA